MAQLARDLGVSETTMRRHRDQHLPEFLPAFLQSSAALTLGELQAEAQRLYVLTLDNLAKAESGVLVDLDSEGTEHRVVSHTAVARFIREARANLGLLAKLSSDAGQQDSAPAGVPNGELSDRIGAALSKVVERALARTEGTDQVLGGVSHDATEAASAEQADVVDPTCTLARPAGGTPGATAATAPVPLPPQLPQFSATPLVGPTDKSDIEHKGIADQDVQPATHPTEHNLTQLVAHPDYPGNHAASKEERAAEGYADIPYEEAILGQEPLSSIILAEQLRLAEAKTAELRRRLRDDDLGPDLHP